MDYTTLITSEHADKPNFSGVVATASAPLVDLQKTFAEIEIAFDLDTAIGTQLDVIGQWVGLSRHMPTPLTGVYFSFNIVGLGFNQGSWKGPFDPLDGLTRLDDETYRTMLRAKIGANHWDGTLPTMIGILQTAFASYGTVIFAVDHQDMSMSVYLEGILPPAVLLSLLKNGYLPLKPEGVRIRGYFTPSVGGTPLFGFGVQNSYVAGFGSGSWVKLI